MRPHFFGVCCHMHMLNTHQTHMSCTHTPTCNHHHVNVCVHAANVLVWCDTYSQAVERCRVVCQRPIGSANTPSFMSTNINILVLSSRGCAQRVKLLDGNNVWQQCDEYYVCRHVQCTDGHIQPHSWNRRAKCYVIIGPTL